MKKLKCITRSYGFMKRLWEEGETVEVADDVEFPKHFVIVGSSADVALKLPADDIMRPGLVRTGEVAWPKGGMMAGVEITKPAVMPTAGSEYKRVEAEKKVEEKSVLQVFKRGRGRPKR